MIPLGKILLHSVLVFSSSVATWAFSGLNNGGETPQQPAFALSDRFKAKCPADISSIYEFDPKLVKDNDGENDNGCTWVAVFRSNNNLPSVLIRDDFQNAMRIATTVQQPKTLDLPSMEKIEVSTTSSSESNATTETASTDAASGDVASSGVRAQRPVAIAKLSPSSGDKKSDRWMIETMRCSLKKEDTDETCDGSSEHTEAIGVCIDELILHHLVENDRQDGGRGGFHGAIRTKATLVSGALLEERGFEEVTKLSPDMATHVSSLDKSMDRYAQRVVMTAAKSSGARDRALQILSYLGRLDRTEEMERVGEDDEDSEDGQDEFDPWAGVKQYI